METYENGSYKIQRKDFKKLGRWEYCFIKGNDVPDGYGIALQDFHDRLVKEIEGPLPYLVFNTDYVSGQAGSKKGRMWVSIRGNMHPSFFYPRSIVKSAKQFNFLPIEASFALRDVLNKYAPGAFACKFPNDVICKEHDCKIAGITSVPTSHYLTIGYGMNTIAAPPDHLLRNEGLKACCLKNHMKNVPTPEEFIPQFGERLLEVSEEIGDDVDKFLTIFNDAFIPYVNKRFKIVINNPNADVEKDGILWCPSLPNTLFKGYLNDKLFDSSLEWKKKDQFWDPVRFQIEGKDDPNYKDIYKKVKEYENEVNKK